MATNDSNLLLIVEAARILEQNGTDPNHSGHNGLNGYSQTGSTFKRSKRMKSQIAQAPTTVEITDLDAYEVDILKEDNPFAKEDEEEEESDDSSNHTPCLKFPRLKFQNAKPVSHAKQIHNEKEKHRRKTLKQAQLALHRVLHPHSHQKPVLRIILCNAIHEIKRLNTVYKENENCLAALKKRQRSLATQLENLKSMDVTQDDDSVEGCTDKKDNDISGPESVDNESFLDVEEAAGDLLDNNDQGVDINEEELIKQTQEKDSLTRMNITETSPGISQSPAAFPSSYAQLYYYTQLLGCTTLLQSMQIHPYLNGGNVWLPPLLWPHLHTVHSTVAGIPGNSTPMNPSMEPFNEANIHQPGLVCSPPVKCSVVKSIGSIDSDRTPHRESLSQNSTPFFCRQLC